MSQARHHRSWDVLVLGGASGTGKSTVAAAIARQADVNVVAVDDLHLAVEALTTPEQQPVFHFWSTKPDSVTMSAPDIVELHVAVARVLAPAVHAVIADHLEFETPMILEGDYLLPELLDAEANLLPEQLARIRAVYLHEPDADQIVSNFLTREPPGGAQVARAEVSQLLGQWLESECDRRSIPVLSPRPFPTLSSRALAALE